MLLALRCREFASLSSCRLSGAFRNFPSVTTSLGQDNSTAPRPRGTVADAHRQALNRGYVLLPLRGTSPPPGGAGLLWPCTGQAVVALSRRRSRQQQLRLTYETSRSRIRAARSLLLSVRSSSLNRPRRPGWLPLAAASWSAVRVSAPTNRTSRRTWAPEARVCIEGRYAAPGSRGQSKRARRSRTTFACPLG